MCENFSVKINFEVCFLGIIIDCVFDDKYKETMNESVAKEEEVKNSSFFWVENLNRID